VNTEKAMNDLLHAQGRVRSGLPGAFLGAACLAVFLSAARAADVTFEPAGGEWSVPANWVGGEPPGSGDVAVFGATGGGPVTFYMGGDREVAGLRFTKTGLSFLYGSSDEAASFSTLSLGAEGIFVSDALSGFVYLGGVLNSTPAPLHQQIALTLTADQTWTNNRTSSPSQLETFFRGLTTPGVVVDNLGSHTLTVTGSGWTELRGTMVGTTDSRIIKEGAGVLALGSNAGSLYLGNIELREGSLGVGNGNNVLGRGVLEIKGGQIFGWASNRSVGNDMIWSANFSYRDPQRDFDDSLGARSLTISGSTLITDNITVTVNNNNVSLGSPSTFSVGPIGDGGNNFGVTKAGPGPLEFLGDNTYTGPTTVTTGTLRLGTGGATGSVAGDIVLAAAATRLEINRSAPLVYDGVISGSGSIVKSGAGGLTLTGANTYTGTLTVNGGALGVNSVESLPGWDVTGRYSVGAAAGITFGNNVTPEQIETIFNTGNVNAAAGTGFDTTAGNRTFSADLATVFPGRNVFKTGPNTLILDGQSNNPTTFTIGGGSVRVASAQDGTTSGPLGLGSIVFAGGTLQYSAANATDYSPRFTAATQIYAADTNGRDVTWSRTFSLGDGGGIAKSGAGTLTLSNTVTMAASRLAASEGTLVVPGLTLTSGAGVVLDVTGGGRLEVTGTVQRNSNNRPILITGDGEVAFTSTGRVSNVGSSTLRVSGGATVWFDNTVNNFGSQVFVDDGVIVGANLRNQSQNSSFGSPSDATRQVFVLGNAATSGTLRYTGAGNSSDRQIQIGDGSGAGGAGIEHNGTGALTLSGSAGWYNVQDATATAGRTLTLSGVNAAANMISAGIRDNSEPVGTVSVVKTGPGRWGLSGTNTYTGDTIVAEGVLVAENPGSLPTFSRVDVRNGATLAVGRGFGDAAIESLLTTATFQAGSVIGFSTAGGGYGYDGPVTGGIGLTKLDANQLSLGGTNTYTGPTSVLGGTLLLSTASAVSPGTEFIVGAGTLAFASDTYTLNNPTTLSVAGTRIISVASGGSLEINGNISRSAGVGNVILSITGAGEVIVNGAIDNLGTGNTSFGRVGVGGTTSLLGLNSFRGTVNVDNGTLVVNTIQDGQPSSIGTGAIAGALINPGLGADTGTFRYIGSENAVTARQVRIGRGGEAGDTGGAIIESAGAGSLTFSAPTFNLLGAGIASRSLTIGGSGDGAILGGIIDHVISGTTGVVAVSKTGAGTWRLAGTNTYTGATSVQAGTLLIDGTSSGAGAVTVASGGTLGGTGRIAGATTVEAGGTLSPGASPGVLGFDTNLTLFGTTLMEIDGVERGAEYDGVDVGGELAYGGSLELVFGNATAFGDGTVFNLFDFASQSGDFTSVSSTGFYSGTWADTGNGTFTLFDGDSTLVFAQQTGNLEISVVPEPSAFVLGLGGMAVLGLAARFRRRQG
jgi:fibronectin-binding autotransporter adhesin